MLMVLLCKVAAISQPATPDFTAGGLLATSRPDASEKLQRSRLGRIHTYGLFFVQDRQPPKAIGWGLDWRYNRLHYPDVAVGQRLLKFPATFGGDLRVL